MTSLQTSSAAQQRLEDDRASASNISDVDSSQGAGTISHTDSALQASDRASDSDSMHMTKGDTDSQATDNEENEEGGGLRLTRRWLQNFFTQEWRQYYRHFELNEKLFLHYKGFMKIENMHLFPDLKTLYFEGNGIVEIGNALETNTKMMSLQLHENMIRKMEGLHTLTNLRILNLSENHIYKIEGLENCVNLQSLYIARNNLGKGETGSKAAIEGLLECPSLECVELSKNQLNEPEIINEVLSKLPNLTCLYLQGNEIVSMIKSYRKTVINAIQGLKYLDDRPVFEDDRRAYTAFANGGIEEERKERKIIRQEKIDADEKMH